MLDIVSTALILSFDNETIISYRQSCDNSIDDNDPIKPPKPERLTGGEEMQQEIAAYQYIHVHIAAKYVRPPIVPAPHTFGRPVELQKITVRLRSPPVGFLKHTPPVGNLSLSYPKRYLGPQALIGHSRGRSVFPQHGALVGPVAEPNRPETAAVTSDRSGGHTHAGGVFCLTYPTSDISARKPGSDTAVMEVCSHNTEISWELSWDPSPSLIGPRQLL